MSKIVESIIKRAKRVKFLKKAYESTIESYVQSHISEITPFNPRKSEKAVQRVNLLVPSINQIHLFGGISTAIQFYNQLTDQMNEVERRIITTDAAPDASDLTAFPEYKLVRADQDLEIDFQITPFNDRYNKTIPVGPHDIFIATSWWTAYFAQRITEWQANYYNQSPNKIIYFIQDFEPGFYAWSSQYALADSTYHYKGPQIAVFNSSLLKDFFLSNGYEFKEFYYFEPRLNKSLKNQLAAEKEFAKEKKILIYGRPSVTRNAFPLIIEALRIWAWKYPDSIKWKLVSAGEQHADIEVGNGINLTSKGKMTLKEYAEELSSASIGISLMVSPHPSYPPLEMAHFGMKVITNAYANKNLSKYHENIITLQSMSPENIAQQLAFLCENHDISTIKNDSNSEFSKMYLNENSQFDFIEPIIRNLKNV